MGYYFLTDIGIGLVVLLFVGIQVARLRRDNYRSDIRALRDGLFDFMWKNELDFFTPAYIDTRRTLNGFLVLSNTMSLIRFFVLVAFNYNLEKHGYSLEGISKSPNPLLEKKLREIRKAAASRTLEFLFLEGFTGLVVRSVLRTLSFARWLQKARCWVDEQGRRLTADAFELGTPHWQANAAHFCN